MKILNVLNNNCVSMLDDKNNEIILYGNGIGYAKKPGQIIEKNKITKTFVMRDVRKIELWREILQRVPEQIIEISENVIEMAQNSLGITFNEVIHIALADHMYSSIDNYNNGVCLKNAILLEIKKFYPQEYQIGLSALTMLREYSGCDLAEDEVGFITMHIVNARNDLGNSSVHAFIDLVDEINCIISEVYEDQLKKIDKESLVYCRYITHIKFFAQRIITKKFQTEEKFILKEVTQMYKKEYQCSCKVCRHIEEKYHYPVGDNERIYLAVHLIQLVRGK